MRVLLLSLLACVAATLSAAEKPVPAKAAGEKPAPAKATGDKSAARTLRVFLVGDSIVADSDDRTGVHGWGEYFQIPGNTVSEAFNRARESRSATSFQQEGHWAAVLAEKPDIVLIEFGHNDANLGRGGSAKALQDFRDALGRYIRGSRKGGATPVLVTPAHSMSFENGQLTPWIEDFVAAMKAVAAAENVTLIDLHARSAELFRSLGPAGTAQLHPAGDFIHFTELGAKALAEIVRRELAAADLKLAWKLFGTQTPLPKK